MPRSARRICAKDSRFDTVEGRIRNAEPVRATVRSLFATETFAHWSERLAAHKVMHERVNSYQGFLEQPHVAASGAIGHVSHPQVAGTLPMPNLIGLAPFKDGDHLVRAPSLGEHSAIILREHGYADAEIAALAEQKVIGKLTVSPD